MQKEYRELSDRRTDNHACKKTREKRIKTIFFRKQREKNSVEKFNKILGYLFTRGFSWAFFVATQNSSVILYAYHVNMNSKRPIVIPQCPNRMYQ